MVDITNLANEPVLAALVNDAAPAWLWSTKNRHIAWANRAGLAFWGQSSLADLAAHSPNQSHGFRHLDRLGGELDTGRSRVERLRFFRRRRDVPLTCKVSALTFEDDKYLLVHSLSQIPDIEPVPEILPKDVQGENETLIENQNVSGSEEITTDITEETSAEAPQESDDTSSPDDNDVIETSEPLARANVVPFRGQELSDVADRGHLTGVEEEAFRAIADALGLEQETARSHNTSQDEETDTLIVDAPEFDKNITSSQGGFDQGVMISAAPAGKLLEFQNLLEKLSAACFIYRVGGNDADGEALFASRAYLEFFGYENMETAVSAKGIAALLPVSPPSGETADDRRIVTITREDGGTLPVLAKLHTVGWAGSAAMMMTLTDQVPNSSNQDVDARGGIDLGHVFETAFEAAIILNDEGDIRHTNEMARDLFNLETCKPDEMTITDLLDSGEGETAPDILRRLADDRSLQAGTGHEVTGKVYGGADIPLFVKLRPLTDNADAAFCATFTDVSRWREIVDAETSARKAAENANEKKSDFLSGLSHEIRTSLNPVLGFSEAIIEERFGPFEHEQYADYIKDIYESGTHLLALVNDMLDLSKIEAGQADLNFASVDINEVANTCVKLMQPEANKEHIIIRTNLSQNMPEIVADEQSLRQITLNLLSNAVKYTGPGGQIIVSTRMTDAGEQQLRVRDTGRGMSQEELDIAVQPFGRAETVRENTEGTGLGLPLTNALIEANRAHFSIDSTAGEGTLVEVTFPVNRVLAG